MKIITIHSSNGVLTASATTGKIISCELYFEDKYNHTREDGERVFIDWEVGGEIDVHDSGCVDVWLTGEDQQGRKYSADGNTQDGELEDISNVEEVDNEN